MIRTLKLLYLTTIALITKQEQHPKPKYDLHKKQDSSKKQINLNVNLILKIIGIIITLIIIGFILYSMYKTGCLDSTDYYYRINRL